MSGRRLTVGWTNNVYLGNETIEVWLKTGSTWALQATLPLAGATQSTTISNLEALTDYEVGIRMRTPSGTFTAGWTEATPNLWSSGSAAGGKDTVTTGATAPTLNVAAWIRISATETAFQLSGVVVDLRTPLEIQRSLDNGGSWAAVATINPSSAAWSYQYVVPGAELGGNVKFRVRLARGSNVTAWTTGSNLPAYANYAAPASFLHFDATESEGGSTHPIIRVAAELDPTNATANILQLEEIAGANVSINVPTNPGVWAETVYAWLPVLVSAIAGTSGSVNYRARFGRNSFGVTDWGTWSGTQIAAVTGDDAPTQPDAFYFTFPQGNLFGDPGTAYPVIFECHIVNNPPVVPFLDNRLLVVCRDSAGADAPVVFRFIDSTFEGTTVNIAEPASFPGSDRNLVSVYEITTPASGPPILSLLMV